MVRRERTSDVVIVGAGVSGLVAADLLRAHGRSVTIVEARSVPGGRVSRMPEATDGRTYDGGAQFVFEGEDLILGLIERFALETVSVAPNGQSVVHYAGRREPVDPANPITDPDAAAEVARAFESLLDMAHRVPPESPWLAPSAAEWDGITFRTWTVAHIRDDVARGIVESQLTDAMGGNPGSLSLLGVLAFVAGMGELGLPQDFRIVDGGLFQVPEALAASFGDDIVCSSPVTAVETTNGGVVVTSERAVVTARAVIIAFSPAMVNRVRFTPALPVRRKLLGDNWLDVPGIKTIYTYERPFWRDAGLSGVGLGDLPGITYCQDITAPGQHEGVMAVFFMTNERADWNLIADAEARRAAQRASLAALFGEAATSPVGVVERDWAGDAWSTGCSYGLNTGTWTTFGPALREPVGPIFWAGTEVAEFWGGSVEGAALAGARAAEQVDARLG